MNKEHNLDIYIFVPIRNKWRNSVKNCEAYSTFSSIGSDHRIITATIRLRLRVNTKQNKRVNYDWATLKYPKLSNEYSKHINLIYDQLITTSIDNNITAIYDHFIRANEDAAKKLIPKKRKTRDKMISQDNKICKLTIHTPN